MGEIILYIASSLDGFIARRDGRVDWLFTDQDYGYETFYNQIDFVVMGRKTYEHALELAGGYPYPDKESYIFSTSAAEVEGEGVTFVGEDIISFTQNLKQQGTVWLVGGGEIIKAFLSAQVIDRFIISVHPIILGDGVSLFPRGITPIPLDLVANQPFSSGLVQLTYKRGKNESKT